MLQENSLNRTRLCQKIQFGGIFEKIRQKELKLII